MALFISSPLRAGADGICVWLLSIGRAPYTFYQNSPAFPARRREGEEELFYARRLTPNRLNPRATRGITPSSLTCLLSVVDKETKQ